MKKITELIERLIHFVTREIWSIRIHEVKGRKSFLIRQLRALALAFRGFREDNCSLHASALTFYSMLSMVPVVAMIFGIAKGFGLKEQLEQSLNELISVESIQNQTGAGVENSQDIQQYVIQEVIRFADNFLESAKGGVITGVGFIVLIYLVLKVLSNIESSFNTIWKVKKSRPFYRKFTDYLTVMITAPVFLIIASGLTGFLEASTEAYGVFSVITPFISFFIKLLPYVLVWAVFVILYYAMPYTKVKFKNAVLAGFIVSILFQSLQYIYFDFQIGFSRYNAIYGTLAALPLFLLWLQLSWLFILFGAEVAFAYQNESDYELEYEIRKTSLEYRKILTLSTAAIVSKRFNDGELPFSVEEIAKELDIPPRLTIDIVDNLVEAGILSEIYNQDSMETRYQPAMDINKLSILFVMDKLEKTGVNNFSENHDEMVAKMKEVIHQFKSALATTSSNKLLHEI